jgi:hypothetical protein
VIVGAPRSSWCQILALSGSWTLRLDLCDIDDSRVVSSFEFDLAASFGCSELGSLLGS